VIDNPRRQPLRVVQADVERLEHAIDTYNARLTELASFVLPGGSAGAALLHVARTIVRRAERHTWQAISEYGTSMTTLPAQYLNRLSDLLFVLARYANTAECGGAGDVLWRPAGSR
jgi:cob(I)alamin adenosyltransferase